MKVLINHTNEARPVMNYDQSAGYNFTVITNKLSRGLTKILRTRFDIGVIEWRVLVHLAIEAPLLASDISKLAPLDKGLISKAFKSLEAKELIQLVPFPGETRRRLATLTPRGEALHDEILPLVQAREAAVFTGLTTAEIEQLFMLLGKIRENIELL